MASGLVIVRFKAIKDTERFLVFLARDNPGLLSDDTDGDLVIWSHNPIMISKMAVQFGYDSETNEIWATFEPEIVKAEAIKKEEEAIWVR
ncbi:MAG: hypothetical protein ACUVXA_01865 [Candidatus Jordarchaeum sp.]|uniref:hypothetical protein n=1 Tax=Candidatus Jordarchaeum sp. TaxID=2823881 RepID=UPI004049800F